MPVIYCVVYRLALLVTSAFLLKGLRNAWIMATGLAFFSLIGHLTKALDYEEASLAAFTILRWIAPDHSTAYKAAGNI